MSEWQTWGASVCGPLHRHAGMPNQDGWLARHYRWGQVLAVCDGLGSKTHSHLGSRSACRAVMAAARAFQRHPQAQTELLLRLIHAHWLLAITPFTAASCATTCLFAIRTAQRVLVGQLGDGAVAVYRSDDSCTLLAEDKQASFANLTASLHNDFNTGPWRLADFPSGEVRAVFLCTDGIADDILPAEFPAFIRSLYQHYGGQTPRRVAADLRRWMTDWPVPGHTDDKTLAGLCLTPQEGDDE